MGVGWWRLVGEAWWRWQLGRQTSARRWRRQQQRRQTQQQQYQQQHQQHEQQHQQQPAPAAAPAAAPPAAPTTALPPPPPSTTTSSSSFNSRRRRRRPARGDRTTGERETHRALQSCGFSTKDCGTGCMAAPPSLRPQVNTSPRWVTTATHMAPQLTSTTCSSMSDLTRLKSGVSTLSTAAAPHTKTLPPATLSTPLSFSTLS